MPATRRRWNLLGCAHLLLLYLLPTAAGIQWLGLSRVRSLGAVGHLPSTTTHCDMLRGSLARQQIRFCKRYPSFMGPVKTGASSAISECQTQFKFRRWNCSTSMELDRDIISKKINDVIESDNGAVSGIMLISGNRKAERSTVIGSASSSTSGNGTQSDQPLPRGQHTASNSPLDVFGPYPIVPAGTREAAFVHAISAAGVAHALTRACSSGLLEDCGCDRTVRGVSRHGFQWSGCSDNIAYGAGLTKLFVDSKEARGMRKWRKKSMMNIHNNEAGRKVLEQSMVTDCKCHGVSGSCELKTCWKRMPKFSEIGAILKDKFDRATRVRRRKVAGRYVLVSRNNEFNRYTKLDLVFLTKSPNFCEFDIGQRSISLGTEQRQCNATSSGIDGCDQLCCHRGYKTRHITIMERCECKFSWCCTVKCEQCAKKVDVHTCL